MKGYKTILSDTYPKKSNRRRDKIKTMEKILNLPVNEFKNLFVKMVSYDPTKRPSVAEIKEDDWFN